ncbi:MAG: hypothetical protein DRH70_07475 [Candidatus Coatesbacteria bacterium]|nr:MAG: hypothetical protein DRH70_07475 [Candidatus Coatesbacteria bacterium]
MVLIIGVQVGASVFWIAYDRRPPCGQDCIRHTLDAVRSLRGTDPYIAALIRLNDPALDVYPPAHRLMLGLLFSILGPRTWVALGLSTVMFAALLIVVYLIARTIAPKDRTTALLATFLLGSFPVVFASSHFDNLSMTLSFAVALSILLLLRSGNFTKTHWSAALGVSIGLGLLVKWSFVVFVVGPLLLTLWHALIGKHASKRLTNLALAAAIAAITALPWYLTHLNEVLSYYELNEQVYRGMFPPNPLSWFNAGFYIIRLKDAMTPVLTAVFLFGFGLAVARGRLRQIAVPLVWLIFAYSILLFIYPKSLRYILPACPALALIAAIGLTALRRSKVIVLSLVLAAGLALIAQGVLPYDLFATTLRDTYFENQATSMVPTRTDWQIPRIVRTIAADWGLPKRLCSAAVAPKIPALHSIYCNFEALFNQGRRMRFTSLGVDNFFWVLLDSEYLVTRTGPFVPVSWKAEVAPELIPDTQTVKLEHFLARPPAWFAGHYRPVCSFKDTNGQTIVIVRRVRKFSTEEEFQLLDVLSPIFRKPEQKEIALRILYRRLGWFKRSLEVWEKLEDAGLNYSWLKTDRGPDLVDVLEAEDMIHNFRAPIFAGRRVPGGWEILQPSTQLAPVLLPEGEASLTLVAKAKPKEGDWPTIQVELDEQVLWQGKITSEDPSLYRFGARAKSRSGMLCIKMLAPPGSDGRNGGCAILDKIIIRRAKRPR